MIPLLAHRIHAARGDSRLAPGTLSAQGVHADPAIPLTWHSMLIVILLGILAGIAFAAWERSTPSAPQSSPARMTRILAI